AWAAEGLSGKHPKSPKTSDVFWPGVIAKRNVGLKSPESGAPARAKQPSSTLARRTQASSGTECVSFLANALVRISSQGTVVALSSLNIGTKFFPLELRLSPLVFRVRPRGFIAG